MGSERVSAAAERLGIDVELVERSAADSLESAAALLGLEPSSIVKSLVVARSDGTFLFALVPGDRQIAWAKLRAAVGVNKLRLPSADEALAATGYRVRVYTPFGQLLPGMAYLVRRLLENTSNESFLRAGFVERVPEDVLLASPGPHTLCRRSKK